MAGETLLEGQGAAAGAAATGATAGAPGAQNAPAAGATSGAGAFVPADAIAFLTEHGADPKSLEGVAEADLKARFESSKAIADKALAKANANAPKAPEKYEFKPPAGAQLDTELVGELSTIAKELKLPQEGAQKVFDLGVKVTQRITNKVEADVVALQAQWLKDTSADAEIGGEKLQENLAVIGKARDAFASQGLRELLDKSKLGNNPEVLRLFFRIGKAMKEDKTVTGGENGQATSMASRLYGKTTG